MFTATIRRDRLVYAVSNKYIARCLRYRPERLMPIPKFEKRLDVAIIGCPNAGKSVLLNCLINAKLAATTRKRHTTRSQILGVFNHRNIQLAFYDTPGFVHSSDEKMRKDVRRLRDIAASTTTLADVVLIVVDSSYTLTHRFKVTFTEMVRLALMHAKMEIILVLNKVDLVTPKTRLLDLTHDLVSLINGVKLGPERADEAQLDTTTFMISALQDDGVIDMKNYLLSLASSDKGWLLPKERGITSLRDEDRVREIVLEMLLEHTHEEIPYIAEIVVKSISPLTEYRLRIDVNIFVDTSQQQRIIIGQQGRTLVKIRQSVCDVLENIFDKHIILYIWVQLRDKNEYE